MAFLEARVPMDMDWLDTDVLQMWVGSEGAANLAASTPAGGSLLAEQLVWPGGADRGAWARIRWAKRRWDFPAWATV